VIAPGPRNPVGMVHGRFQPFHLGHLAYALAAAARCTRLVVGLTNPDPLRTRFEPDDPERARPEANPFPYHLRERMVRAALSEGGVPPLQVSVVPFPVSDPDLWPFYVPDGAVHFLRVFDAWGAAKVARLRAAGYEAVDLGEGARKTLSGSEVRRRWRAGDASWRELVPPSVAALMATVPGTAATG
jgi:nicotinamide-nucleotide adenylyltransferase